nr:uncharacterized protein LOC113743236 [Coffea arabica]
MKETTQSKSKNKPPQSHQQSQPKVMQLSSAAAASSKSRPQKPLQILQQQQLPVVSDQSNNNSKEKKNNSLSEQELKLAAIAISLNVRLRTSDMPVSMQEHALRYTRSLVTAGTSGATPPQTHRLSPALLARSLKKEFDGLYGPAWHCVVGKSFGSFVTHSPGGFVYFSLDSLSFLLFKTEVQLVIN